MEHRTCVAIDWEPYNTERVCKIIKIPDTAFAPWAVNIPGHVQHYALNRSHLREFFFVFTTILINYNYITPPLLMYTSVQKK